MAGLNRVLKRSARLSITAVGRQRMRALNRAYRGVDRPTNVLSIGWGNKRTVMGDIIVCPAVIAQEVPRPKMIQRTQHLIVHAALHILGYDHEHGGQQARTMERLEQKVLGWNPYQ
ncbi:rRNA maturation RNase YbeY [Candidatus Uhrbacteria bacterium]|nr:rRNA maturation RNase YbeY [Candidatus Uhrbacteria bacterium]